MQVDDESTDDSEEEEVSACCIPILALSDRTMSRSKNSTPQGR